MNINKILITGNVTAGPEIRYTPNGKAVLSASLANNEYYTDAQGQEQKVTTFVNLEVWGKPAENFSKLVKKGQELFAEGTDKQTSARRTRLYLLVENWQFTQYKRQEDNNTPEASASAAAAPSSPPPTRNQEIVENLKKPKRGTK